MGSKLFVVEMVQHRIQTVLDKGLVQDPRDQVNFINDCVERLGVLPEYAPMMSRYFHDQVRLEQRIEAKMKELQDLQDEYSKNAKEMYDEIKRL